MILSEPFPFARLGICFLIPMYADYRYSKSKYFCWAFDKVYSLQPQEQNLSFLYNKPLNFPRLQLQCANCGDTGYNLRSGRKKTRIFLSKYAPSFFLMFLQISFEIQSLILNILWKQLETKSFKQKWNKKNCAVKINSRNPWYSAKLDNSMTSRIWIAFPFITFFYRFLASCQSPFNKVLRWAPGTLTGGT